MILDDPLGDYRNELFTHCYRMLGSYHDAEDVMQEIRVRALRGAETFEGRSSIRTWLYRIATNACLNELDRKERRVLPIDVSAEFEGAAPIEAPRTEIAWLTPIDSDPQAQLVERESVELAFVAAAQHLAPNQRAALLLFDVLRFTADEIAELMATTAAAVNSAVQRARTTLAERRPAVSQQAVLSMLGDDAQLLVRRYTDALRHHDVDGLLELLTEDASWSMPPVPNWYRGRDAIAAFLPRGPFDNEWRHRPVYVNGQLGVACFVRHGTPEFRAYCIDVLDVCLDGRIAAITAFIDPGLFARFGLPESVSS